MNIGVPVPPASLTLLHSERPKLYRVLVILGAKGLKPITFLLRAIIYSLLIYFFRIIRIQIFLEAINRGFKLAGKAIALPPAWMLALALAVAKC